MNGLFDWLKKAGTWILLFFLSILSVILGIERHRRRNAERERDNAEAEAKVSDVERKGSEVALESITNVMEKVQEIDEGKTDYDTAVDAWNSDGM